MRISDWSSDVCSSDLGEGLWAELTPQGIDVLTLCPGATDTEAPARQGIDPATLHNIMSPDDVARLALDNLRNGPVYVSSEHYRAVFERLRAMPRRDALMAMAGSMKRCTRARRLARLVGEIGSASGRERGCQYV